MKTKHLTHTVLLMSMAALTPAVLAQSKPGTGYPVTGAPNNPTTVNPDSGTSGTRNQATDRTTDRTGSPTTGDRTTGDRTTGNPASGRTGTDGRTMVQPGSLTTVIADSASYSTLTKALKAAGLDTTLGNKDEFTIFAPTDEAFEKLPAGTLTKLMQPENKEKLRMLLLNHVIAGKMLAAEMTEGDVTTASGEKLKIDLSDDKVEVEGAKVSRTDVSATNGVMHGISEVLVPKSLEAFADLKN